MTPTLTRPPRPAQSRNVTGNLLIGVAVAAIAVVALALAPGMRLPTFVDRVSITNPTVFGVEAEVRGGGPIAWLDLGGVARESTKSSYEVIDQGRQWMFRFTYAGRPVGEVAISRAQLKAQGWRVEVPAEVGDRLAATGTAPSVR